jgi:hypothetical protein
VALNERKICKKYDVRCGERFSNIFSVHGLSIVGKKCAHIKIKKKNPAMDSERKSTPMQFGGTIWHRRLGSHCPSNA